MGLPFFRCHQGLATPLLDPQQHIALMNKIRVLLARHENVGATFVAQQSIKAENGAVDLDCHFWVKCGEAVIEKEERGG